jgi:hypothetical protein
MVPTARLELARPRSLPPQDSVSTNSTTSAKELALPVWQGAHGPDVLRSYFGISTAFEPSLGPGAGAGAAGCVVVTGTAVRSSTLVGLCC